MSDLIFFAKTLALTILLVVVLQIQIDEMTLEEHAMGWVQSAAVVGPLHTVANSAAQIFRNASNAISGKIHQNVSSKGQKEEKKSSFFRWTMPQPRHTQDASRD